MGNDRAWNQAKAEWRDIVLVCRKCSRKLDGGFGPDGHEAFAKALRGSLGELRNAKALRREVAVIVVGGLDVCSKRAIVVVKGSEPETLLKVPEGAEMAEVVERLRLHRGDRTGEIPADVAE